VPGLSLASRFLITLLVTTVLPFLVFGYAALHGMRALVEQQVVDVFMRQLAAETAQRLDARLDQIEQACSVVREIARTDLPRDPQAAAFAEQVELVPDLLDNYLDLLLLANAEGEVLAGRFGQLLDWTTEGSRRQLLPQRVGDTDWFRRAQKEGAFWLPWGRSTFMHRGLQYRSLDPAGYHLGRVIDVPRKDGPAAVLLALIRWPEMQQILDGARRVLQQDAGLPSAEVSLVALDGTIQACTDRSRYGEALAVPLRAQLLGGGPGKFAFVDRSGRACLAGFARCGGEPNRTWSLCLSVPTAELFATSDAFQRVLVLALLATVMVLVVWSLLASRAIVRPVQQLAQATRAVAAGDLSVRVPVGGGAELGALGTAFNAMAAELASGRERLNAAERQSAWAEMARQIAHEIKNPLTPMRMVAQLLERARREGDPRADAIAERLAKTVLEQTEELDRIATGFRAFAGAPDRRLEEAALDDLLADARRAAAALFEGGKLLLELLPAARGVRVRVDRQEIGRVLLNLLQNAAQASAAGVRVRLTSAHEGGKAVVGVEDDGPGVPDDVRARLFEPYFTTKSAGTGLGLAICRRLVEVHGGTIVLQESAPGRTVFRIELPVVEGPRS